MHARLLRRIILGTLSIGVSLGAAPGVEQIAWAEGSATLDAAASAPAGSEIPVRWTGPHRAWDRIGVVKAGTPDSAPGSGFSAPVGNNPVILSLPEEPGEYELRYFAHGPNELLARRPFTVLEVTATLQGPPSTVAGAKISVEWSGPSNRYDRIGILKVGTPDGSSSGFSAPVGKHPVQVSVPETPGDYEIRYLTQRYHTLAKAPLRVEGTTASVEGPSTAVGGSRISVDWSGPDNEYDRIGVLKVGTPETAEAGGSSVHTGGKHPVQLIVPEKPGDYEIRYITLAHRMLAKAPLSITAAEASIKGPGTVVAGSHFKVEWKGPGNDYDHIILALKGAPEDQWKASRGAGKGGSTLIDAPLEAGQYELRYQGGLTQGTLARDDLQVTPAKQEPGQIRVSVAKSGRGVGSASGGSGAVEVILDASGSMLQRIGSERRIDIAKHTLETLTSELIPAGTPFALRVFGRQANSCQTDLDIPLSPLDVAAVRNKVDALNAHSNAKTPIGASLEKVAADLSGAKGERLVILVTDGEETCGGNPARAIEQLRKGGANVRINIVGFAVDDRKTAALFRHWSSAGGGSYFDARDAASMNEAFSLAVRPVFEVVDTKQKVVAEGISGGGPVSVLPGTYVVRRKGVAVHPQLVIVRPKTVSEIEL
jgi:hypothetical protein